MNTYKVYHTIYAAGGRMWPSWRTVEAESPEAAEFAAKAASNRSDAKAGRCNTWGSVTRVERVA